MGNRPRDSSGVQPPSGKNWSARTGTGVVEVMIAAVVVGVAVLGAATAMLSSMSLTRVNRDAAVVRQAARRQIEELQGVPFAEVFAIFNDDLADDAGLTVAARGSGFTVLGLTTQLNDADGLCGRIEFPVAGGGPNGVLREDVVDDGLGMPRDLDMDGIVDGADHSSNYALLPVRVHVEWRGASGNQSIQLATVLSAR